jgi:hypothetical protein
MLREVNDDEYKRVTIFSRGKMRTNKFRQSPKILGLKLVNRMMRRELLALNH